MHLLLNQWTVTIRFHICLGQEIFFLLHRQIKYKKNERRKENLIDFSFGVCLVESLVSGSGRVGRGPSKWHPIQRSAEADCENSETSITVANHMESFFSLSLTRCVGGSTGVLSLNDMFLDVTRNHYVPY